MSSAPDGWPDASYGGAERQLRRAVARATPQRRMAWLEEALELAQASGALTRVRRMRQAECERNWRGSSSGQ